MTRLGEKLIRAAGEGIALAPRAAILSSFLGKPWEANAKGPDAYDCWHLARAVSLALFDRAVPEVAVPVHPTWAWMIDAIESHPERAHWSECPSGPLVKAGDGAIVLMARMTRPAHIGIWLQTERRIIHCDPKFGVVLEAPLDLATNGWRRLRYYESLTVRTKASSLSPQ